MSLLKQPVVLLDAPSNLGLRPPAPGREPGTNRAPEALRAAGLLARLNARDGGRVLAPPYQPDIDPITGIRNASAIHAYSLALSEVVGIFIDEGSFPLVIGGDCSILLGNLLALRLRGDYGLIFIDGHTDFQTPQTSASGGAAGMDLALACGRGPDLLTNLGGHKPLVKDQNVIALGFRDMEDPADYYAPDIFQSQVALYSLDRLREMGIEAAVTEVVSRLQTNSVKGFWIHVDVDVLNSDLMPAVDSPMPGGLTGDELSRLLRTLLSTGLAVGLEVTIFDPDLDPDGSLAKKLVEILASGLSRESTL
jgi:arginase